MSFGFGVGDFLAVVKLANDVRARFLNAPREFVAISKEVRILSFILQDIGDVFSQEELPDQHKIKLEAATEVCQDVLQDLEHILDQYQELDPDGKKGPLRPKMVWKRLRWDPKTIGELRSRLTASVVLFSSISDKLSRQTMLDLKDGVGRLVDRQLNDEEQAILDWLAPADHGSQQSDILARREEHTGEWLLKSVQFGNWLDGTPPVLFCPGIPGAGKTIMTSIVVDSLSTRFRDDEGVGIAYFYYSFRKHAEQKPIHVLASILKQLAGGLSGIPDAIRELYHAHRKSRTTPSIDEIMDLLRDITSSYRRCFILIDALDECDTSGGNRRKVLSVLSNLLARDSVSLFATSRPITIIMDEFKENGVTLEIRAAEGDVRKYLDERMSSMPRFVRHNPKIQEEIKCSIVEAVQGMFLLAQFHLDSLEQITSLKALRAALQTLPTGSHAYDEAYITTMNRIKRQNSQSQELAGQVLSWVVLARAPLSTLTIQHALAVEVEEPKLDPENISDIDDVLSVCAGLVTVDEESDLVRLVHYTTQIFFERTLEVWYPNAHANITKICMAHMSFAAFEHGMLQVSEVPECLAVHPLYGYAVLHWGYHAEKSWDDETSGLILPFLEDRELVSLVYYARKALEGSDSAFFPGVLGIHFAASYGIDKAMTALLGAGVDANSRDNFEATPLICAAQMGHESTVRLLVATAGVDLESQDDIGRTALLWAICNGHDTVVQLLLESGGKSNNNSEFGATALHWAVSRDGTGPIQVLLSHGAEIEARDDRGNTPLLLAAMNGWTTAAIELLAAGADIKALNNGGEGALDLAIQRNSDGVLEASEIVELLLSEGAPLNKANAQQSTRLQLALELGRLDLAWLFDGERIVEESEPGS